ncbi:MAG: glutathione S-transferase family protein [Alphaproteobacteria bacterium]
MLELLGGPTSTCCCKVHLAAVEKGLELFEREVNVHKHQNLTAEYIAMNRDGMVPTLLHDGMVLVESSVIMRYLDRRFPEPPLTPSDPVESMRLDLLMKDLDEKYHSAIAFVSFSESSRGSDGELTDAAKIRLNSFSDIPEPKRREQRRQSVLLGLSSDEGRCACGFLETMIRDIDAALELGPFLAGDRYSLADAALTPYVHRLWLLGCEELWSKDRPRVERWYERIKARPSFAEVFTKHEDQTRHRYDRDRSNLLGTWERFRGALESIGKEADDPAVRMPPRIWRTSDL